MAIPINKYVDITSGVAARDVANRRDLMGLVLTASEEARIYFKDNGNTGADGIPWIAEFASDDEVRDAFGSQSEEYHFAVKYFSFVSKTITRPKLLKFAYWEKAFPSNNYGYDSFAIRASNSIFARKMLVGLGNVLSFSLSLEGMPYSFSIDTASLMETKYASDDDFYLALAAEVNAKIRYLHVDIYDVMSVEDLNTDDEDEQNLYHGRDYYHFEIRPIRDSQGKIVHQSGRPIFEMVSHKVNPAIVEAGTTLRISTGYQNGEIVYGEPQTLAERTYFIDYFDGGADGTEEFALTYDVYEQTGFTKSGDVCEGEDVVIGEGFEIFGLGDYANCDKYKTESPVDAISRIAARDDNFGSFTFLDKLQAEEVMRVSLWNHNKNYKFLFSYSDTQEELINSGLATALAGYAGTVVTCTPDDEVIVTESVASLAYSGEVSAENPTKEFSDVTTSTTREKTVLEYRLNDDDTSYVAIKRTITRFGYAYHTCYIPMVLLASTQYSKPNSTKTFMYQTFGSSAATETETNWFLRDPATVSSMEVARKFDNNNVNYIGETQQAGKIIRFYQDGFNTDGLDTACYCNEIWLKDAILCEILNAFVVNEKVPANTVGESIIRMRIMSVVDQGISNGTILVKKTLTTSQMEYIDRVTGEEGAWESVVNNGYYLSITLTGRNSDKSTAYTASYLFLYSKGDAIRKVEGSNILI